MGHVAQRDITDLGVRQRHGSLDALQRRRERQSGRQARAQGDHSRRSADRAGPQRHDRVPHAEHHHSGVVHLHRRGRRPVGMGRRHGGDPDQPHRRRDLQGPGDRTQPSRPDAARCEFRRPQDRRLGRHVRAGDDCRDVQRSDAASGLRTVQRGRDRRPDLRDVRPEGRRGRHRRAGTRVRRRVHDVRRMGGALRQPRRAQLAVGHHDGAGQLRSVLQRPADRQLRRRSDPRVRPDHRRGARHAARHVRCAARHRRPMGSDHR